MENKKQYHCPKCGEVLDDAWDGEPVSAFVGKWSDDRFYCPGKEIKAKDHFEGGYWINRTKSCGYFGLEDLGESE